VFCSFLALVLKQELESRIKQAELQWEWKEVIRGLDALQQVDANFQGRRFLFRSHLTAHASQAVRATGVAIPPYFARTPLIAPDGKRSAKILLALRKSLNVNNLIFQTVEDGFKDGRLDLIYYQNPGLNIGDPFQLWTLH
jgi:hypothetical protein